MRDLSLRCLFVPKKLAMIGSFSSESNLEWRLLFELKKNSYQGKIFPVNGQGGDIQDVPCLKNTEDLPADLDSALICLGLKDAEKAFDELLLKRTKSILVFTGENIIKDRNWIELEQKFSRLAHKHQIYFTGLDSWGLASPVENYNLFFKAVEQPAGNIAFFSHSGTLGLSLGEHARENNWGFSRLACCGVNGSIQAPQALEFFQADEQTKAVGLYVEHTKNGDSFIRKAQDIIKEKPVILLKPGRTSLGLQALSAHNGLAVSSEMAWKAAVVQSGVIRVDDFVLFADLLKVFSLSKNLPKGDKVGLVSNSFLLRNLIEDFCIDAKLHLSRIFNIESSGNEQELQSGHRYLQMLKNAIAQDVDSVLVLLDIFDFADGLQVVKEIGELLAQSGKAAVVCIPGGDKAYKAGKVLDQLSIPCYKEPLTALAALQAMVAYVREKEQPYPVQVCYRRDKPKAEMIIQKSLEQREFEIFGEKAQHLLQAYELPQPRTQMARTSQAAAKASKKIGFPVMLKIASPHVIHKSDIGGVSIGLYDTDQVRKSFQEMTARIMRNQSDVFISGCQVQEMLSDARDVIIRFQRDTQFGPMIVLTVGADYQNKEHNVAFRLAPLGLDEAQEMVSEIESFSFWSGAGSGEKLDFKALEDVLLSISQMALDCPQIYEAEFSPVLVGPQGVMIADAGFTLY